MIERTRLRGLINAAMIITGDKCKLPKLHKCRYKLSYVINQNNDYTFRIDSIYRKSNKIIGSLYNTFIYKRGETKRV